MEIDVADLLERAAGALDGELHRADYLIAVGIHLHAVVGVARRPVPFDAGVNARAARTGAVLAFEHQHPRALAQHETITPLVEGA